MKFLRFDRGVWESSSSSSVAGATHETDDEPASLFSKNEAHDIRNVAREPSFPGSACIKKWDKEKQSRTGGRKTVQPLNRSTVPSQPHYSHQMLLSVNLSPSWTTSTRHGTHHDSPPTCKPANPIRTGWHDICMKLFDVAEVMWFGKVTMSGEGQVHWLLAA